MQTFVPYPSFELSASVLDYRRLGKQRVETYQILKTLTGESSGWANHPATKMWQGHPAGLCAYGIAICSEWTKRGYQDTCAEKMRALILPDEQDLPFWWGDTGVHASHRSNLMRKANDTKNPKERTKMMEWYGQWGWEDDPSAPYVWPALVV